MSLFGDSPDDGARKTKASLFADDSKAASNVSGGGLFGDSGNDDADSAWNFTPKKQARGVKNLLSGASVPESYIDAYDALIESGEHAGFGVSISGVRTMLQNTGLSSSEQTHILKLVTQGSEAGSIDRGSFNVLLALVGLAQEKEDVTLDGVDERRKRLPTPNLPQIKQPSAASAQKSAESPVTPTQSRSTAATGSTVRTAGRSSFSFPEQDPWGSPQATRSGPHDHSSSTNGAPRNEALAESQRTTSSFTSGVDDSTTTSSLHQSSTGVEGWGGYSPSATESFRDSGIGSGFEAAGGGAPDPSVPRASRAPREPRVFSHGAEEVLVVATVPEKEGPFMFQHRNYEVSSSRKNSKVIRRYSDFVWLLDCLHKRYPFRQLPLLPPKRIAINGQHIAADISFIEKRRRGLSRFVNALIRHPVLKDEQLVTMFLTVPTELSSWKKQAVINVQEEFVGRTLPPTLEDSLPPTLDDLFSTVRSGVQRSAEAYISLCAQFERILKRQAILALDYTRISTTLGSTTEFANEAYKMDTNDVPMLNEGITATAKHFIHYQALIDDQSRGLDETALEDFKQQRDALVSMRDMFDRRDRYARDNIPQLEKRIANNENKLAGVRAKPEEARKAGEAEKLEQAIMKDKESIVQQHARGVLIKECIRDEISHWQSTQYHINRMHQDLAQELVKYSELQADNWRLLSEQVENLPVHGS